MRLSYILLFLLPIILFTKAAEAQRLEIPRRSEPLNLTTPSFRGALGPGADTVLAFSEVIRFHDKPWLQLRFGPTNLGDASYVELLSLEDGSVQTLNGASMLEWNYSSVYFNGDAVRLSLYVAPGDTGIAVSVAMVVVGLRVSELDAGKTGAVFSLCDGDDDRVGTADAAVARTVPTACTAWIASNGSFLTAGHCVSGRFGTPDVVQFNVPDSDADGTINNPPASDQYPITQINDYLDNGYGVDWGVITVGANSETGLLPVEAQNAYYRMSRDISPTEFRVTGYGIDDGSDHRTLQTDTGSNDGEVNSLYWEHRVDTDQANSGSPIIDPQSSLTAGIHTHGGCGPNVTDV